MFFLCLFVCLLKMSKYWYLTCTLTPARWKQLCLKIKQFVCLFVFFGRFFFLLFFGRLMPICLLQNVKVLVTWLARSLPQDKNQLISFFHFFFLLYNFNVKLTDCLIFSRIILRIHSLYFSLFVIKQTATLKGVKGVRHFSHDSDTKSVSLIIFKWFAANIFFFPQDSVLLHNPASVSAINALSHALSTLRAESACLQAQASLANTKSAPSSSSSQTFFEAQQSSDLAMQTLLAGGWFLCDEHMISLAK